MRLLSKHASFVDIEPGVLEFGMVRLGWHLSLSVGS